MAGEFADSDTQQDDALADARLWGLADEEIDAVREALGRTGGQKLWAMHAQAMAALVAGGTQWRTRLIPRPGKGLVERVTGLDYSALKVALDFSGIALDAADWSRLMVLEHAAAAAMNGEPA